MNGSDSNSSTGGGGGGGSGGSGLPYRYAMFFLLLKSEIRRNAWYRELYDRILLLERINSWIALVIVPICFLIGLCGNLTAFGLMLRSRSRWSKPHVYITCLLPTNALIVSHQFFSQTVHRASFAYTMGEFEFPMYPVDWFCQFWGFVMNSANGFAMLLMVALVIDRLHALTLPFSYRGYGLKLSKFAAAFIGLLSLCCASPVLGFFHATQTISSADIEVLSTSCFVPSELPNQRNILTIYFFLLQRGGVVSLVILAFNAFLACRIRQIRSSSQKCSQQTQQQQQNSKEERKAARVTLLIFSLSLFYMATLTPAAAVLGVGTVYSVVANSRDDPVGFYLNVLFTSGLGLLFNVFYAVFYGFNWIIYAKDVAFVRAPMLRPLRRCLGGQVGRGSSRSTSYTTGVSLAPVNNTNNNNNNNNNGEATTNAI